MAQDSFFTPLWYRVAQLRPRMAQHVRVERHRYQGRAWYALHDPLSSRVHRVTPSAYLFVARMDGQATVDAIWTGLVEELDTNAPGQDQVVELLMQLHDADLLQADIPPDAAELLSRRDRLSRSIWSRNLRNPLSMQFPLVDPDRFLTRTLPLLQPLLGRVGMLLWLALVVYAAVLAGQHWDELSNNILDRVLAGQGLFVIVLCYPVLKILHELGHGYVAERFGCEVREMGILLLVLFPVPYVDASASAALRSKWQRAAVASAGIAVEMAVASLATIVWVNAAPGVLRAVAYDLMVLGGVSTLLVNGNPLLRFDGYYVMSDLIEVPNLGQRSNRFLGHLVNRYLFGLPQMRDFAASRIERAWMLLFAPSSWLYRMAMLVSISLFVASHYLVIGVAAASLSLANGLVLPLLKGIWRIAAAPQYRLRRARAAGLTFGALAAVALVLMAVPAPLHSTTQGVVWLPDEAMVRAGSAGFITQIVATPGQIVHRGETLMQLEDPLAQARVDVTAGHVDELQQRLKAEWVDDRVKAEVTRFELGQEQASLTRETLRVTKHAVLAGGDGVFQTIRAVGDMPGRYVKEGELIGYVTPKSGLIARIIVPQSDIDQVSERLASIQIRLGDRQTDFASTIVRAQPGGQDTLPSQALALNGGGEVAADPRDSKGLRTFERNFQFDLSVPDTVAAIAFGSRVYVRFDYQWQPVGRVMFWRLQQVFHTHFDA